MTLAPRCGADAGADDEGTGGRHRSGGRDNAGPARGPTRWPSSDSRCGAVFRVCGHDVVLAFCEVKITRSRVTERGVERLVPGPPPVMVMLLTSVSRGRL